MAVLVEAITVVVRCSTLDEKYPGGAAEYQVDAPNRTFCTDGELTAVSFMHPGDVRSHIERLRQEGIRFMNDDGSSDEIAVVDRTVGPTTPCAWLGFIHHFAMEASFACLAGSDPEEQRLVFPAWWTPEISKELLFIPTEEANGWTVSRREAGTEERIDEAGTKRYIGRTGPP